MNRFFLPTLLIVATLALAGCESSEEKAERYYQSALTLLEEGDVDRALVELRNVFDYNGFHKEARQTYAGLVLERGEVREAYGQYLRLIEQYPDTLEVRLILAGMALDQGNWEEVERHGGAAMALDPDNPEVQAVAAALAYRTAALDDNADAMAAATSQARAVLETLPGNSIARRVVIDSLATGPTPGDALPEIDMALAVDPESLSLHVMKFRLLAAIGDEAGTEAQLERMYALFPDNSEVRDTLIAWYMTQENTDGAEALLRDLAGDPSADTVGHVTVVQFLQQARGTEAAEAELDRLIAATDGQPQADLYRALRAALTFDSGERDAAIAAMDAILASAEPSDQTRQIKVMLAQMLIETGNPVGARALVEEVIAEDASNVAALKMRAVWLIAEDQPGPAIIDLRNALNQAPRDPEIMTLMASAHERDGSTELAGERLALAVEVSGGAPAESIRYAQFMVNQNRPQVARSVLTDARRISPRNLEVLRSLADLAFDGGDWATVADIIATLDQIDTEESRSLAEGLRAAQLLGQDRSAEMIAQLEQQIAAGDSSIRATALLIMSQLQNEDPEAARAALDAALAEDPENPELLMLDASLSMALDEPDRAETILRDIVARFPEAEAPTSQLYRVLTVSGRAAEASQVLDTALGNQPGSRLLRTLKAVELEAAEDIDGAIAIYEALYTEDTNNVVIANNLASLIATYGDDADLERAAAVARRLRGREVPAFQDTYGWIEYRRGNLDEALPNLEAAAAGLPEDPTVQVHLGMVYAALDRVADARRQLTLALEMAGDSPLKQFEAARETLAGLPAE